MTPEHLVAFASAGTWLSGGNESHRDSITPSTLSSPRMHTVLDAIASLCVRAGKGEVYAVGLQLSEVDGSPNGTITLTIAGNRGVPVEVSKHLRATWMKLQDIAKVYHKHYKDQGAAYSINFANNSPPSKDALHDASEMLLRLKLDFYQYGLQKFVARLDKHYDAFMEFSKRLKEYWLHQPESNIDAKNIFVWATDCIEVIRLLVSGKKMKDIDFNDLVRLVDQLQRLVRSLVTSHWQCLASWHGGVAGSKPVPLIFMISTRSLADMK